MSAVSSTGSAVSSAITTQTGSSTLDREAFMLLLVTQFQYQDPLNPMEDKEFIAQLAQFSSLEQMMNMNESMTSLTAATKSQEMVNATSYIGKTVDVSGSTISKETNATTEETTVSRLRYAIGQNSVKGQLNIFDSSNNMVNSIALPAQSAGTHEYIWDGTVFGGAEAADGVYRIVPTFYNADGDTIIDYDTVVDGVVSGVINDGGVAYLALSDGRTTPLSEVRRVSVPTVVDVPKDDTDDDADDDNNNSGSTGTTTEPTTGSTTGTTTEPDTGNTTGTTTEPASGSTTGTTTEPASGTTTTP